MKVDRYAYWGIRPPEPSRRCVLWVAKINAGWLPNQRIRRMGYDESSEWYGVYIWEYLNVIQPLINEKTRCES